VNGRRKGSATSTQESIAWRSESRGASVIYRDGANGTVTVTKIVTNCGSGSDADLNLSALSPDLPVEAVLEYRRDHTEELNQVRAHLATLARRIQTDPWTDDFAKELDRRTIPDLVAELDALRQRRDDWVDRKRRQGIFSAAGLAAGTGAAVLTIFAAPITPIVLAIAGLSLVSGSVVPGAEWLNSWREGRAAGHENGLTYLLHV
jgi:hypothetical protein